MALLVVACWTEAGLGVFGVAGAGAGVWLLGLFCDFAFFGVGGVGFCFFWGWSWVWVWVWLVVGAAEGSFEGLEVEGTTVVAYLVLSSGGVLCV